MIDSRAHTDHSSTHRVKDTTTLEYEIQDLRQRLDTLENIVASALEQVPAQDVIDYGAPYNTRAECQMHACSYFTNYLASEPAYLTHEAFHGAERSYRSHLDTHFRDDGFRWVSAEPDCPTCDRWKKAVRA